MRVGIFSRLRNVHTVFGDVGGALDFADLILEDGLGFGMGFLSLFLFGLIGLDCVSIGRFEIICLAIKCKVFIEVHMN